MLSHARRTFRDRSSREKITLMHALHRTAYMGERRKYAIRKAMSFNLPSEYCSIISDGMAQNHCVLPHQGQKTGTETYYFMMHS